jgi:hypothetical protein
MRLLDMAVTPTATAGRRRSSRGGAQVREAKMQEPNAQNTIIVLHLDMDGVTMNRLVEQYRQRAG